MSARDSGVRTPRIGTPGSGRRALSRARRPRPWPPLRFGGLLRIAQRSSMLAFVASHCLQAHAQSSVALYGVLDTSIEITNPGAGWVARMDSGAYRGSRIGVRGREDIGDGLALLFDLENGFSTADGTLAVAGSIFNRQAWVGLDSRVGTFRFGRQYSPIYIPFKGALDAFGAGTIASGLNNLSKITPYESNALTWISPDMRGISATVMVSLRDGGTSGNGLGSNIETIAYRRGPIRLSFAHQQQNGTGALRANLAGISYGIGPATAFLSFFNGDGGTPRYHDDGAAISLRYAASARVRASVGYTYARDRSGAGNDADQFSAACEYDLSKHVLLYASAGWLRNRGDATFTLRGVSVVGLPPSWPGASVRGVQLGMIDRF